VSITVALNGDVIATPGSIPPGNCTPAPGWTAGPIIYTNGMKIKVDGTWVITKAECTFIWTGTPPPPGCVPVATNSKVTLNPDTTKLKDNSKDILRNGNTAQDSYLNTLTAVVSQIKLKTA
jgi:hypothetical protein